MKRQITKVLALSLLGGSLVVGCHTTTHETQPVEVTPTGQVVVPVPPPPPRAETMGTAPVATYAWVPGYWTWQGKNWVWVPGHWQNPPHHGNTWVPGHWDQDPRGWVWTPGHWE